MEQSESVKNIIPALVNARKDIKNLYPSSKGYGYSYVPLEKVIDLLKEVLPEHGLGYIQLPAGGDQTSIGLTTRIIHTSGEWLESTAVFPLTDMKGVNKSQMTGAALTYFRRYALCAAFGITGDEDVDASDIEDLSRKLQKYINEGRFDKAPKWKERAVQLIAEKNAEGMRACLDFCENKGQNPGKGGSAA